MKKNIIWIARTGVLLAVLIALQSLTKPFGQIVTGCCVNAVLALSATLCGLGSGIVIAILSPVLAFLFGIAPNIVIVPVIMLGNLVYVLVLDLADWRKSGLTISRVIVWPVAAVAKFGVLYFTVNKLVCGILANQMIGSGILKEPMLKALPVTFGVVQLITALIGGAIGILLFLPLRKAVRLQLQ